MQFFWFARPVVDSRVLCVGPGAEGPSEAWHVGAKRDFPRILVGDVLCAGVRGTKCHSQCRRLRFVFLGWDGRVARFRVFIVRGSVMQGHGNHGFNKELKVS